MTRRRRPRTAQERVIGVLGTVAPGSLGGRIRNTRPVSVVQPNTGGPPPTSGFDPSADPIIIGSLAGATSPGGVVVGKNGLASAADAIAIGENSAAISDSGISIGASAGGQGLSAIAIGGSALVQVPGGTDADYGIAIGQSAHAAAADSVAIGRNAAATLDHQIMLGNAAHFVEIPGSGLVLKDTATSTRYLLQITSGALVLNTAP